MESYKTMNDGHVQRQSDLALIPPTDKNKDYVKYLDDVKNGAQVTLYDYAAEEARQKSEKIRLKNEKDGKKQALLSKLGIDDNDLEILKTLIS